MPVNVKPKLGLNAYKVDTESHISINHDVCKTKCTVKFCTFVCPARVYTFGVLRRSVPPPSQLHICAQLGC